MTCIYHCVECSLLKECLVVSICVMRETSSEKQIYTIT